MPKKNNTNGIHAQRLKAIRSFVNFDYDLRKPLTRSQKRTIKKYHDAIESLTARPNKIYRPRSKKHKQAAQKFAQHPQGLTGLKVAFIPIRGQKNPKLKFNSKGEAYLKSAHVNTGFIPIDPLELIQDTEKHINEIIRGSNADRFGIAAGEFEIPNTASRELIAREVAKKVSRYTSEELGHGPESNHYVTNWLVGLTEYTFNNQASEEEFRRARIKFQNDKEDNQKERKNRKLAIKRLKQDIREYKKYGGKKLLASIKKRAKNYNVEHLIETLK